MKLIMISSAAPNEGKTLTATNIALTLSESYQRRVLLIDADLRRPSLDHLFRIPVIFGLSEALSSEQERTVSVIQVSKNLSLLPGGKPNSDPMSMLTSDRMRRLLAEAAASFDWVIIDTPPVGILTDANLLGAMVDAAVLVVRAGKTPLVEVQRAVQAIGREKILGVVLNRAERRTAVRPIVSRVVLSSNDDRERRGSVPAPTGERTKAPGRPARSAQCHVCAGAAFSSRTRREQQPVVWLRD